jgi:hypothetical protein
MHKPEISFAERCFSHLSRVFIVDSAPVEICKAVRAKRSNICATDEIHPDFG